MGQSSDISLVALIPHAAGIVACFLLVGLFSGLEAGLLGINRIWLSEQVERGSRRAKMLQEILRVPSRLIAVMLTMETTCSVVLAVLWTYVGERFLTYLGWPLWFLVLWGAILVLLLVTFCEIIPKAVFAAEAERRTMAMAPLAWFLVLVVHPFAFVLEKIAHGLIRLATGRTIKPRLTTVTEEDLMTMVSVGEDEGVLEEQEREMIHSIFEFGDLVAREIMVPRVDMVALDINASVQEALSVIVKHGHSRIPVYEGSPDHIKGLLYAKDLLRHVEAGDLHEKTLAELIRRDAFFVPGTKDLSSLLEEMQARKAHMAIVMDEYGGTAGLVTIEDILEEIVGEIQDEYDRPVEQLVVKSEDGTYIMDARLGLHDFDDEVGVELPAPEGVETVGGLLYQVMGRIPEVGETVSVKPVQPDKDGEIAGEVPPVTLVTFKVLEVEENRIGKVQVTLNTADQPASDSSRTSASRSEGRTPSHT